jgi:hypothetical protein
MERVIKWLVPKEEKFFDMLKEQSANVLVGAKEFQKLVSEYPMLSTDRKKEARDNIKKIESMGDDIVHKLLKELDRTFITPLDKEDIHGITVLLDDIIDLIDAISERFIVFNISRVDSFIKSLAEILVSATMEVDNAISSLKKLRDMNRFYIKIHSLENESDRIYYNALSSLFRNSKDPTEIIKYKDIYQLLEDTIDKCEDVANIIESVVVKHA